MICVMVHVTAGRRTVQDRPQQSELFLKQAVVPRLVALRVTYLCMSVFKDQSFLKQRCQNLLL